MNAKELSEEILEQSKDARLEDYESVSDVRVDFQHTKDGLRVNLEIDVETSDIDSVTVYASIVKGIVEIVAVETNEYDGGQG